MLNQITGWLSVLAGVLRGVNLGVKFQEENWLGGYSAFPRRMTRLAHIACVALGMLNIQFAETAPQLRLSRVPLETASWAFVAAAVLMPACCLWLAGHRSHIKIFALPVGSLVIGLLLTLGGLLP